MVKTRAAAAKSKNTRKSARPVKKAKGANKKPAAKERRPVTKKKAPAAKERKPAVQTALAKRATPMTADDRWWGFIEGARKGAADPDEMVERLIAHLANELDADEIIQFDTFVNERMRDAFRWDLWAVAYIMNGGCSDDGFDYFCGWLIGKGKAHYLAALANPEDASNGVSPDDEPFENEGMWHAAARAWEGKTGKSTDDFYAVAPRVMRELQGEPFDEETVEEQHPKLARKFGGG